MSKRDLGLRLFSVTDRRSFLRGLGLLGVGAVVGGALRPAFKVLDTRGDENIVSRTRTAMGTSITITVAQGARGLAEAAIAAAFDEMDRLIVILSRHDSHSALAVLNAEGRLGGPPPELVAVLLRALVVHRQTGGAFDPTVKPLIDALEASGGRTPDLTDALGRVDAARVNLSENQICFEGDGMGVTLDGVAKGYIVDRMSDALQARGASSHLINAGGDIRARRPDSERPWTIAIQDPQKRGNYPDVIRMGNGAIATSGGYERSFGADGDSHHIVDPRRGTSPREAVSVSVRADCVTDADALSTAVFVMGPDPGTRFVDSVPGAETLVLDGAGRLRRSRGWRPAAG